MHIETCIRHDCHKVATHSTVNGAFCDEHPAPGPPAGPGLKSQPDAVDSDAYVHAMPLANTEAADSSWGVCPFCGCDDVLRAPEAVALEADALALAKLRAGLEEIRDAIPSGGTIEHYPAEIAELRKRAEVAESDALALWAVRTLDAWAAERGNFRWTLARYRDQYFVQLCASSFDNGKQDCTGCLTPDAARLAAANALAPELGAACPRRPGT